MCVYIDFIDLNKAWPKKPYPLPNIHKLVDNSSTYQLLSFLDIIFGYNQIKMKKEEEENTAFITEYDIYYAVMPFELKNAKVTYQKMMEKHFKNKLEKKIVVYVDDMVVKSTSLEKHLTDMEEIFKVHRKNNMRLNPTNKYVFNVQAR